MKVCFAEDIRREDSGKHKFLHRLAKEFKAKGIKVVDNNADILLHIGRNISKKKAKKVVMRVDGLILNKAQSYKKKNDKILRYINKSDAIIYQSLFCERSYRKFLGVKKKNKIIFNGANPNEFLPRDKKNFFLANCRWRPHKREKQTCESFIAALERGLDSDLIVAGNADKTIEHPRIRYAGWIHPNTLRRMLSEAIATIHLSWLDWCPNSMVESIVAGCPIIYSDSGGSSEVGFGYGIGIDDDNWDFKNPCYLYNPPKMDENDIIAAMFDLKNSDIKINGKEFHVSNIADEYILFFREVLEA